jgi:phosphoribosyl-ATP pyrophosphohydrolase/phosphoribosyl-AMP cyclohydrolase
MKGHAQNSVTIQKQFTDAAGVTMSQLPLKLDAQGLVPAIVQDHVTGEIRMFAYASDAAVRRTLETGRGTFWSRSRGELWQKGRVSGHEIPVVRVLADCDADCVIYSSDPQSPSCHSGAPSCFFQAFDGDHLGQASAQPQSALAALEAQLVTRERPTPDDASTVAAKIREGAGGLAQAIEKESDERVVAEAADAIYHLAVGLRARSIALRRVLAEVARRLVQRESVPPPSRG